MGEGRRRGDAIRGPPGRIPGHAFRSLGGCNDRLCRASSGWAAKLAAAAVDLATVPTLAYSAVRGEAMTPEDFRRFGHLLVDWLANYHAGLTERPVMAQFNPGDIKRLLPAEPPLDGEAMET